MLRMILDLGMELGQVGFDSLGPFTRDFLREPLLVLLL